MNKESIFNSKIIHRPFCYSQGKTTSTEVKVVTVPNPNDIVKAPEIDAASGTLAIALLVCGMLLAFERARRRQTT